MSKYEKTDAMYEEGEGLAVEANLRRYYARKNAAAKSEKRRKESHKRNCEKFASTPRGIEITQKIEEQKVMALQLENDIQIAGKLWSEKSSDENLARWNALERKLYDINNEIKDLRHKFGFAASQNIKK